MGRQADGAYYLFVELAISVILLVALYFGFKFLERETDPNREVYYVQQSPCSDGGCWENLETFEVKTYPGEQLATFIFSNGSAFAVDNCDYVFDSKNFSCSPITIADGASTNGENYRHVGYFEWLIAERF